MFWTIEKLTSRIAELSEFRYRDSIPVASFRFQIDAAGEIGTRPPAAGEWKTVNIGEHWSGRDLYAWLAADVAVPAEWKGRKVLGRFDFGRTGHGNTSGFESLLYVDGAPYQGVDSNHEEVFFSENAPGSTLKLNFRLWTGLEGGGKQREQELKFRLAELAWLDEAVDDLYFTGKAVIETVEVLDVNQPERDALLKALDRAMLVIDWSRPGSEAFYRSAAEAGLVLHNDLKKIEKRHSVTVRCIGHTHIDVAWLWRLQHTREKSGRSFSTVLRLMDQYPDYVFLQTQPQLYEYIKHDYPDIYEEIRKRVKEGRWEADGGMWLEADCNLTSGESLVRQILYGTRFLRNEFGVECTYLWLPDVFGYSWALPQILKKSGLDTFMTTKISWNQYNRMPHDTFNWRGIDGTEILTHFITTPQPGPSYRWWYTYNGTITPKTVKGIWDGYRDKSVNQDLLLAYGYGDGGGGVNREMLEMRRRLNEMPGLPNVETGRADEYFRGLQERVANTDQYVHTWDGELYLEYHRGTYTSQAYNKLMNRKLELLYRETEWLCVFNSVLHADWSSYPKAGLDEGWKIILRNQFHDIIPGSSIREVYEDSTVEYQEAEEIAQVAWKASSSSIAAGGEEVFTVFNSSSWERPGFVFLPAESGKEKGRWVTAGGQQLNAQITGNQWFVQTGSIPSMGYTAIRYVAEAGGSGESQSPFVTSANGIRTPHYEIEWNESGQLTRIYDRVTEREVLASDGKGNVLQVFEDKPMRYEAWDIDIYYQQKMREITNLKSVKVTEAGPVRAVVRFEWSYTDSTIGQDMIVYTDNRRIDFETVVDWQEQQQLLKVAFPVDIRATEATYDIQFGNVTRPTHWNTSWDYARFETVGHQWVDLSEQGYGVSLLNNCKYGHDIKNNMIRLSLIKSALHPDVKADQGKHAFTYSLLPHAGTWVEGGTVQEAWALNNPFSFVQGAAQQSEFSLFRLSVDNVQIDAVKKAEDTNQLVIRVHEFTGARCNVRLESDLSIQSWQECDLLERMTGKKSTQDIIQFNIKPYEIKTFVVDLARV